MADTPVPRSPEQILGDMIDAYRSKQGVKNMRVGGPLLSLFEAAMRSDARSSQDVFQLLNSIALDNSTGLALDRAGADEKLPRFQQAPASGTVTISDTSFTKLTSKLYQGSPAPIVGSVTVDVVDASLFPNSGSVYIGRGTPNYEGPIVYTSKTNNTTHWTLNLASGTTRFHNTSEVAIVAQGGNRTVGAGIVVRTPQANVANAVEFRLLYARTIPDGETSLAGIQVVAQKPGTIGNVGKGDIREFASSPFNGAAVTNPTAYSNGREVEKDDDYRERIKARKASKQLGTQLAITTFVTGITASDENKRVSSASYVKRLGQNSTLYIDDGTGYEEVTTGVPTEVIVDEALGGEQYFDLVHRPVARAFVTTGNASPYELSAGANLTVKVGGESFTHSFDPASFASISSASAFEVAASINSNPALGFLARTSDAGTELALFSKTDQNEFIEVVPSLGTDANVALGFPTGVSYTLQLYKNDRLLVKDGQAAAYAGLPFSQWNAMTGSQDLSVSIDGTPAIDYTFVDQDFINGLTGFNTLGKNSAAAWATVINGKIPGVTATVDGGRLVLTSNAGLTGRAAVSVTGGSLVGAHLFAVGSAQGADRDYVLDRNRGEIALEEPLAAGDRLTVGSINTRAFFESGDITTVTTSNVAKMWFVVDGDAQVIATGVNNATALSISVLLLHDWGHTLQIAAASGTPFTNVRAGDWLVLWDPALDASLQGSHRVVTAQGNALTIERRSDTAVRLGHRSVALQTSGSAISKVLSTGGTVWPPLNPFILGTMPLGATEACSLFDPNTNLSTPCAPMLVPRVYHTATLLANGKVLVVGGVSDTGHPVSSIEIYDPVADTWTASGVSLTTAVFHHQATLLANGKVLVTGGDNGTGAINKFQVYDPNTDTIAPQGTLTDPRAKHKAVLLPVQSDVLIVGGYNGGRTPINTAEIWNHTTLLSGATGSMTKARQGMGLAAVGVTPTTVLVAGNGRAAAGNTTREVYSIAGGTWGAETALPNNCTFEEKDLCRLTNGHVVGLHGFDSVTNFTGRGFTYDGTTFSTIAADPKQTDSSTKFEGQYVEIKDGISSVKNLVCAIGGGVELTVSYHIQPTAQVEIYNEPAPGWTIPDPADGTGPVVSAAGVVVVRTDGVVREVDVPVGTNYTANTIAGAINADVDNPGLAGASLGGGLTGAAAVVYKTTRVRIVTNTFNDTGDIALVTQNTDAQGFELTPGSAVDNLAGHVGSVLSRSELGTPSFSDTRILATSKGTVEKVVLGTKSGDLGDALVGLRNWWRGADGSSAWDNSSYFYPRAGGNFNTRTRLTDLVANTSTSRFGLRAAAERPWTPQDRAYLAAPFAIGPNDDLTVVADNDASKRFAIKMYRDLATVGNTYSSTNTFKDKTAGSASLAATFGLTFDFNDFAVYMPARAVAYPADNSRSMLFRYYRLGPDGNGVRVRIGNPLAPNQPVSVGVQSDINTGVEGVTVRISSGAARTLPNIHPTTTLMGTLAAVSGGVGTFTWVANLKIASASRAANVDTLTLTLPPGVVDHGIAVNDQIWIASTDVNFASGLKTITARTPTTISYAETAANVGPDANIGTASRDTAGEASFSGGSVSVGDFFLNPSGGTETFRISVVDGTGGYLQMTTGDQEDDTGFSPDGTLDILNAFRQIFAGSSQTTTQVVAAVNALAAAANSTCPVTAFVLGTGAGVLDRSTVDNDNAQTWYTMADGVNWVLTTTPPGSLAGDYQLTFKKPITGSLATGADWQHETVRICPTTTKNVVDWLNSPTVSGLFSACYVQSADDGRRVQIASRTIGTEGSVQVQGGLANGATAAVVGTQIDDGFATMSTIRTTDATGFVGGAWARVQNTVSIPIASALGPGYGLLSWDAGGLVRFNNTVVSVNLGPEQVKLSFERQGDFVAISDMGINTDPVFSTMSPGSWVRITPSGSPTGGFGQVSTANQGIFRVLRIDSRDHGSSGTVWIENPNAIEERVECTLEGLDRFTALPGDKFVVASPIFGVDNQGTWTIKAVGETSAGSGDQFTQFDRFTVDVSTRAPVPQGVTATLDLAASRLVKLVEGEPAVFVLQAKNILPNQTDGSFTDVRWDTGVSYSAVGAAEGSIITLLDKMSFPLDTSSGTDGYNYDVGLIGEANRVVYGDPGDTSTYPGVAAEGSDIDIQGPLVKRLQFSLLLRTKSSGVSNNDVADRVRSAVATVVNQSAIGQPIALSAVVAAAQKVVGVVSVTILSPVYNAGNDLIPVQTFEKALVLNLDQDIQVTFAGD